MAEKAATTELGRTMGTVAEGLPPFVYAKHLSTPLRHPQTSSGVQETAQPPSGLPLRCNDQPASDSSTSSASSTDCEIKVHPLKPFRPRVGQAPLQDCYIYTKWLEAENERKAKVIQRLEKMCPSQKMKKIAQKLDQLVEGGNLDDPEQVKKWWSRLHVAVESLEKTEEFRRMVSRVFGALALVVARRSQTSNQDEIPLCGRCFLPNHRTKNCEVEDRKDKNLLRLSDCVDELVRTFQVVAGEETKANEPRSLELKAVMEESRSHPQTGRGYRVTEGRQMEWRPAAAGRREEELDVSLLRGFAFGSLPGLVDSRGEDFEERMADLELAEEELVGGYTSIH